VGRRPIPQGRGAPFPATKAAGPLGRWWSGCLVPEDGGSMTISSPHTVRRVREKSATQPAAVAISQEPPSAKPQLGPSFRRLPHAAVHPRSVLGQPAGGAEMQTNGPVVIYDIAVHSPAPLSTRPICLALVGGRGRPQADPEGTRSALPATEAAGTLIGWDAPRPYRGRADVGAGFRSAAMGQAANRAPRRYRGARRQSPSSPHKVQQDPSVSKGRQP
jgi:hypothetical protein